MIEGIAPAEGSNEKAAEERRDAVRRASDTSTDFGYNGTSSASEVARFFESDSRVKFSIPEQAEGRLINFMV